LKSRHRSYYVDAFYKYKLVKIINKAIIKLKTYNISDFELATLKKYSLLNILNNDIDQIDNFNNLKN